MITGTANRMRQTQIAIMITARNIPAKINVFLSCFAGTAGGARGEGFSAVDSVFRAKDSDSFFSVPAGSAISAFLEMGVSTAAASLPQYLQIKALSSISPLQYGHFRIVFSDYASGAFRSIRTYR